MRKSTKYILGVLALVILVGCGTETKNNNANVKFSSAQYKKAITDTYLTGGVDTTELEAVEEVEPITMTGIEEVLTEEASYLIPPYDESCEYACENEDEFIDLLFTTGREEFIGNEYKIISGIKVFYDSLPASLIFPDEENIYIIKTQSDRYATLKIVGNKVTLRDYQEGIAITEFEYESEV